VALGEIPSPRVKKPASIDITVEAVIETRQAADGHVEAAARPEPVDATDAHAESTVAEGEGTVAEGRDREEGMNGRRQTGRGGKAILRRPAIRLVELSCDGKLKLGGPLPRDGGDDDAARCGLLKDRAMRIERFNQALERSIPRDPVDSRFDTCSRAVREMASRRGLEDKSYKNRVFVKELCAVNKKIPRPGRTPAAAAARRYSLPDSLCCSAIHCPTGRELCGASSGADSLFYDHDVLMLAMLLLLSRVSGANASLATGVHAVHKVACGIATQPG
ncbi:hypothetical protein FOZ63_008332, partial [Perkinsus olseni]